MEKAHIVCLNDSTIAIIDGSVKKANEVKELLKKEHQKKYCPCKEYDDIFFWHLHEDVPVY